MNVPTFIVNVPPGMQTKCRSWSEVHIKPQADLVLEYNLNDTL